MLSAGDAAYPVSSKKWYTSMNVIPYEGVFYSREVWHRPWLRGTLGSLWQPAPS